MNGLGKEKSVGVYIYVSSSHMGLFYKSSMMRSCDGSEGYI